MSAPGSGPEPTTGMETGSDAGAPGDHLPDVPLDPSDRATLSELLADGDGDPGPAAPSVEDDPAVVEAVEDDSPLPPTDAGGSAGGADRATSAGDADDVVFQAADDEKRG